MLYSEIIAVYSEIYTKHINTLVFGQHAKLFNVKFVVQKATSGLQTVNCHFVNTCLIFFPTPSYQSYTSLDITANLSGHFFHPL